MAARLWWSGHQFGWMDTQRPGFRLVQLHPPEPLPVRPYPKARTRGVPLPYPTGPETMVREVLLAVTARWPDHFRCQVSRLLELPGAPHNGGAVDAWGDRRVMRIPGGVDHLIDRFVSRVVGRELQPWTACGVAELGARIDSDLSHAPPHSRGRHAQLANLWLGYVDEKGFPYRPISETIEG